MSEGQPLPGSFTDLSEELDGEGNILNGVNLSENAHTTPELTKLQSVTPTANYFQVENS